MAHAHQPAAADRNQGWVNDRFLHNNFLKACAHAGDVARAERFFQQMQSDGVEANIKTYGKLMEAAAQAGDVETTKKWFDELRARGKQPPAPRMARAHFKAQNFLAGRQWLFDETFRDRLAPDIVSYNELLAALGELGDKNTAAEVLLEVPAMRLTMM
eukprot:s3076_g6.t1